MYEYFCWFVSVGWLFVLCGGFGCVGNEFGGCVWWCVGVGSVGCIYVFGIWLMEFGIDRWVVLWFVWNFGRFVGFVVVVVGGLWCWCYLCCDGIGCVCWIVGVGSFGGGWGLVLFGVCLFGVGMF